MAKQKQQPLTKKDFQDVMSAFESMILKLFKVVDERFNKVNEKFDKVNERFDKQDAKILDLQLDSKDLKRNQQEMIKQQKIAQASLVALDKRVRFQDDFPERLKQAEYDIHDLKLNVHRLKAK